MQEALHIERHIEITDDQKSLVDALCDASGLSHQAIKTALDKGCVWLSRERNTRRIRRVKTSLKVNDQLHLYYDERILNETVPDCALISDENAYSIWFKPYGVYSQGSKWGDHCTVTRQVEKQLQKNIFLVHRLDRAAQGLMVVAHKKTTAAELSKLFSERRVLKKYQAVVHGCFPMSEASQTIDTPIDGKASVSHVTCLAQTPTKSLVEVRIETGRKHQIRRHLAQFGYPIVGDRLHGIDQHSQDDDLQLCSNELSFKCPITGKTQHYQLDKTLQLSL